VKKAEDEKDPKAPVVRTKKDIVIYLLLSIFTGLLGLDKYYIGLPYQGLTKFLTAIFPLTFLFGWMWIFYDAFYAIMYPDNIVHGAIRAPIPYNMIFATGLSGEGLFIPEQITKEELAKEQAAAKAAGIFGALGFSGFGNPFTGWGGGALESFRFLYRELAVPVLQPTVGTTIQQVDHSVKLAGKAVAVGTEVVETVPKVASSVSTQLEAVSNPNRIVAQIHAAAATKAAAAAGATAPHTGGGSSSSSSSSSSSGGPIIAGTLSAVAIAGAVKMISELLSDKKR
jgi:TM2 domain-containing membrane protein YozV